ncbi:citrate/2-methylcitrate synthase [Rathayibacter sp. KR2-224]|uniref:citrate/2-methylcitrate synthase n=1 Tax=Rathayibacter sp. KR2-224 TaxID=3400913 RepID=UPI003C0248F7
MDAPLPRLSAAQAAARLGVRQQTLYAYVSRGLLSRERNAQGSTFDALELEQFASSRRRSGPRTTDAAPAGSPLMVLDTDIALVEDGELYFRGVPAAELALGHRYESVARWLWGEPLAERASGFGGDPEAVAAARTAVAALGSGATPLDRIQVAVPVLGAVDPTRHDLAPSSVRIVAERLIGGVVAALAPSGADAAPLSPRAADAAPLSPRAADAAPLSPRATDAAPLSQSAGPGRRHPHFATAEPSADSAGTPVEGDSPIADAVWTAFTGLPPTDAEFRALNAALVLLVDHDLAVSTLAARAAASARATPYAVVSSGLGALDSALHGNASRAACELIGMMFDGEDARTALARTVARTARPAPGFGHAAYSGVDPRAGILLPLVAELPDGRRVLDAVDRLTGEVLARTGRHPNVDLALAALTTAARMPPDAGAAIFAVGRMAGWIAHALDEYAQRPLRLRPRGRYVGPMAGSPPE